MVVEILLIFQKKSLFRSVDVTSVKKFVGELVGGSYECNVGTEKPVKKRLVCSSPLEVEALFHADTAPTDLSKDSIVAVGTLAHELALGSLEGGGVPYMTQIVGLSITPVIAETHAVIALQEGSVAEVLKTASGRGELLTTASMTG